MLKVVSRLAAVAVTAALWCGAAEAKVMTVNLAGDWNDDPFWRSWSIELSYDTSYFDHSADYFQEWNGGGPSPVFYAKGLFSGVCDDPEYPCDDPPLDLAFDITEFTYFAIDRSHDWDDYYNYTFSLAGPGVSFQGLGVYAGRGDYLTHPITIQAYGHYGDATIGGVDTGGPHTEFLQVTSAGVPEPSTWAMMIMGFGLAGAALRRRGRPIIAQAAA